MLEHRSVNGVGGVWLANLPLPVMAATFATGHVVRPVSAGEGGLNKKKEEKNKFVCHHPSPVRFILARVRGCAEMNCWDRCGAPCSVTRRGGANNIIRIVLFIAPLLFTFELALALHFSGTPNTSHLPTMLRVPWQSTCF